jgi:hypothetical protein
MFPGQLCVAIESGDLTGGGATERDVVGAEEIPMRK